MKNLALIFIVHVVQDAIVILIAIVIVDAIAQKKIYYTDFYYICNYLHFSFSRNDD